MKFDESSYLVITLPCSNVTNRDVLFVRPILMQSESELQIFTFRPENRIGLVTQSDSSKSDGTKSDLKNEKSHK